MTKPYLPCQWGNLPQDCTPYTYRTGQDMTVLLGKANFECNLFTMLLFIKMGTK